MLNRRRKCFPAQAAVGDKGHTKPGLGTERQAEGIKTGSGRAEDSLRLNPKKKKKNNFEPSVFLPLLFTLSVSRLSSFQD